MAMNPRTVRTQASSSAPWERASPCAQSAAGTLPEAGLGGQWAIARRRTAPGNGETTMTRTGSIQHVLLAAVAGVLAAGLLIPGAVAAAGPRNPSAIVSPASGGTRISADTFATGRY